MQSVMKQMRFLPLVLLAAAAAAAEPGLDPQRYWAPTGDTVTMENHATIGLQVLDSYGDPAKGAEDWQLLDEYAGNGLLNWYRKSPNGYALGARAFATSGAGGLSGRYVLWGRQSGLYRWDVIVRNANHYYDTDSEMRAPSFKYSPAPPALEPMPHLEWWMGNVRLGYMPSHDLALRLDFDRWSRLGDKSSLLRNIPPTGASGPEPPERKRFDTATHDLRLQAAFARGGLDSDLGIEFRKADGDRSVGTRQSYVDDQQLWRVIWNAGYNVSARVRVFGTAQAGRLTDSGSEQRTASAERDAAARTLSGGLGILGRLGRSTNLRFTGRLDDRDTQAQLTGASGVLNAVDRQANRGEFQAALASSDLAATRLQLRYRYRQTDLDEATAQGDLPAGASPSLLQLHTREAAQQDVDVRARRRLGRKLQLGLGAAWQSLDVEETASGDDWLYWLGDVQRNRLSWDVTLYTRPVAQLRLDLGYHGVDQSFERLSMSGVETNWTSNLAQLNLTWMVHQRLSLYGLASWGQEELGLSSDPSPDGTLGTFGYDGTSVHFAPGATLQVTRRLQVEAAYEGVRFEDQADESAAFAAVQADSDRLLLRARIEPGAQLVVTATYRRHEFDENRWDDYIHDVYLLSVSRTF